MLVLLFPLGNISTWETMLWPNFILGLNFISLGHKLIITDLKCRNDENIANRRTPELLTHRMAVLRKNWITFISGLAKGCSIVNQVRESLRGDLFSADSLWELGCVGGFVGSMNLVPRVRERVGEPLRMSLMGLCWYRVAKEAEGGGGGRVEYLSRITQTFCTPSRIIGKKWHANVVQFQ